MEFIERCLGRLFYNFRGRDVHLICNADNVSIIPSTIQLTSSDFNDNEPMPLVCTSGEGEDKSPSLEWKNMPEQTKEILIILEDPDAPLPKPVIHMICRIPPTFNSIEQGVLNIDNNIHNFKFLPGIFGRLGYHGPRPVRMHGSHRYIFQIYALNEPILDEEVTNKDDLIDSISKKSISRGTLTGTFERF
ncbi:phosphatidylethanolamine-binding protein [Cavenderia fasciculata]|uniref:Phosphatidylethanolamine-binding protein n=1 Tax=Cavenderia fasciculata TaxID=261658 RepID=F4PZV2_CACFS|nr:phosphatidylethanolamine-binding protein [Cavenderia fasciculata]EGG18866.1 phosphatidylethanolamine-binding protein [Cavenderia fasciculata]|eukprot:XP_004357328.1 phosphatidylethanolamine-binding protein [Cavenderia fasciculata]